MSHRTNPSLAAKIAAANQAILVKGRLDDVPEFFVADYVVHLTGGDVKAGHATVRKIVNQYRRAFPDLKVKVEILVSAKDRVAWQRTLRATHRGRFKGFPATGRRIVWRDMVISRFRRGKIAEDWVITDLAEQLLRGRKR